MMGSAVNRAIFNLNGVWCISSVIEANWIFDLSIASHDINQNTPQVDSHAQAIWFMLEDRFRILFQSISDQKDKYRLKLQEAMEKLFKFNRKHEIRTTFTIFIVS